MMDKIDKEKQNLMSFLQTEDRYINTKHAEIKKKFDDLEKDSNEINARAAVLEKRAKSLDERTKEIENKHADINKRHEDFKKEMGFISNLSVDQRWKRDNNMYFHGESIVYENIITELRRGRFKKVGNPRGWIDNRHHAGNKWHKRELLRVGYQHNGWNSGLSVNVPEGYNVLWIRCANHV
ncbi:MAG: hypothetical protein GY853_16270, partial [PVC group bacterium]|nr:hypothetical protein [PVC group bacterium]